MTALQAAYGSNPAASTGTPAASAYLTSNPGHIAAVINFWGSMFDTSLLKNNNVPVVSVHGNKDRIVPAGKPDKGLYGSLIIHRYANVLHIPNSLKIYEGYAHEPKSINLVPAKQPETMEEAGILLPIFIELFVSACTWTSGRRNDPISLAKNEDGNTGFMSQSCIYLTCMESLLNELLIFANLQIIQETEIGTFIDDAQIFSYVQYHQQFPPPIPSSVFRHFNNICLVKVTYPLPA